MRKSLFRIAAVLTLLTMAWGNAVNADGTPNTAHSLNPVPIVVVSDRVKSVRNGILADVAPTVLKLMGLKQPAEMTGEALVDMK